jgi:hypothetical protein
MIKMESGKNIIKQYSEKVEKNDNNHKYKWKINKIIKQEEKKDKREDK